MKWTFSILAALWFSSPITLAPSQEENKIETEHLIIVWHEGTIRSEIETAKTKGERFYSAIRDILGHEPKSKITIRLRGAAEQPNGRRGYPHVDSWGRINLFRFEPSGRSYFSALAHEMVHAFRFRRSPQTDWFFEEGFAEFVAKSVDPSFEGFPWYGFPVVVAAGQWLANGEDIILAELRSRHKAINLPCRAQSYSLRSSFFLYLGKTYGDDALLQMAGQQPAGEVSDYPQFFKKEFEA